MRCFPFGLLAVLGLCLSSRGAGAATYPPPPPKRDPEPRKSLSVAVGGAWTTVPVGGGVRDAGRGTAILEVQISRALKVGEDAVLDYRVGFVPVEVQTTSVRSAGAGDRLDARGNRDVYGWGLDPVGFGIRARRGNWRPFATLSGGVRFFQAPVPHPDDSRINFAATLEMGVLRRIGRSPWLSLGVSLHHVSNGGLAEENPGLNQVVLNVAYVRLW